MYSNEKATVDTSKNLIDLRDRTPEERSEIARKGAEASIKVRREKKTFQEVAKWLINLPVGEGDLTDITKIENIKESAGANITGIEQIMLAVWQKAARGDVKAAEFIRDTLGQNPATKVNISSDINPDTISKIESLVKREENQNDREGEPISPRQDS